MSRKDVAIAAIKKLGGCVGWEASQVSLKGTQVTDADLEHLKGLTSLDDLRVRGTQVTDAGVNELKKALPNCEVSY